MLEVSTAGLDLADLDAADFAAFDDDTDAPPPHPRKQRIAEARALKTRSRVHTRRAASQAKLLELLPQHIDTGDSWHVISGGDVDSLSYLQHLVTAEPWQYLMVSTWCMAMQDVEQIAAWLAAGRLQWVDAYTAEILPSQYPTVHEALCTTVRRHAGRVATFRNHSKVALLGNFSTQRWAVIESSANLNTNPRTEQTAITIDAGLFAFYADFFDGIKSYNANFPDWRPWRQAAQVQ